VGGRGQGGDALGGGSAVSHAAIDGAPAYPYPAWVSRCGETNIDASSMQ
jgi:hypothetical protein